MEDIEQYFKTWKADSFEECAEKLDNHMNFLLDKHFPKEDPKELKRKVATAINTNTISSEKLRNEYEFLIDYPGDFSTSSRYYIKSYFSSKLLAEKLNSEGKSTQALSVLAYCGISLGQLDAVMEKQYAAWEISYENEKAKKIATNAAYAKNLQFKPAQIHLTKLISEEKPKDGWKSRSQAASTLAPKLFDFVCKNAIPLREDAMQQRIKDWMREIPEIKEAILKNLRDKPH